MKFRNRIVPLAPFVFSMILSLSTAGSSVFWQDSGFVLSALHENSVLYPHGFILYFALCKAWAAVAAPIFGFTLAVHYFSSLCAAGAAAFLAVAARDFLRRARPEGPCDGPAIAAACMSAAGYSFWTASTLAKPYALFYLVLAALLWLMIRAEKRPHFLALGALLGLAWAAHPSAAILVPAMLAYAWARRDKVRELGAAGMAGIVGIAALLAFVPSFVGLPILAGRESLLSLGDPRTAGQVWSHLRGANFTNYKGAWGFDTARGLLAGRFIWEEYLGIGLIVLGLGLWRLGKERPRELMLIGAWVLPMLLLPVVFVGEGMFDQWLVAAYLPLAFGSAAGFSWLAGRARVLFPASVATSIAWMILANFSDLNFKNYDLAEVYGRLLLRNVEPGATVVASTDDAVAIPTYLQKVLKVRPDVKLVRSEFLGLEWYDRRLERDAGVKAPSMKDIAARTQPDLLAVTAFANANVAPGKPVYSERPSDPAGLNPGLVLVPAGALWKTVVEAESTPDPRQWDLPIDPFAVARQRRRSRGIFMRHMSTGAVARFEPYEDRLVGLLVQAQLRKTEPMLNKDPNLARVIYEKALTIDGSLELDTAFQYNYGLALYLTDKFAPARDAFEKVLKLDPGPARETLTNFYLAEIARAARDHDEAKRRYGRALEINGADPVMMIRIRARSEQP